MISVMKDDYKFERRSGALEDSTENARISEVGTGNLEEYSNLPVADEGRDSILELGSGAPATAVDGRFSENVKSEDETDSPAEEYRVRVSSESDGGRVGNDLGSTRTSATDRYDDPNIRIESQNEQSEDRIDRNHAEEHGVGRQADAEKRFDFGSKSLLAEFDDYVAAERNGGIRTGVSKDLGYGFEVGDMVWGKVKSHPWWPGHIFNEAFASPVVRRTKREGHVLVAFFGDSSYGWFEPDELIPFDANFSEKSGQTYSRTFLKAVEEAVDEANRRRGLGLACKCRNANNFRLTNVQGYFSVDVPDYEPGVYSSGQIKKARNSFKPSDTLAFIKQLASAPQSGDCKNIGFIKNKATVFAYRRAVFEQNDETYAQAFGVQPSRTSYSQANALNQPAKQPPKAPLSGPLVMAETLAGGKNSTKSVKVKDNSKKDRYLFKRRDETANSVKLANRETSDAAGRYVFQKRASAVSAVPQISDRHDNTGFISKMAESLEKDDVAKNSVGRTDMPGEKILPGLDDQTAQLSHPEDETSTDFKDEGNVKLSRSVKDFQEPEQVFVSTAEGGNNMHQVKEAKHHKISADGIVKKAKVHKRPAGDSNSENSVIGEKKKKKKKESFLKTNPDPMEKQSASGKVGLPSAKSIGNSVSIGLAPREDFQAEQVQVDVNAINLLPMDGKLELPQLLSDLQALALDPFHGVENKIPAIVRQFFLRFRSLVYQKSLVLSPPMENESPEVRVNKSPSGAGVSGNNPDDHVRASTPVKPAKHIVRPNDPTKAGPKRAPSDRQEEIAAKRLKKIKDLKQLAAEKKAASQKTSEIRREGKESTNSAHPKSVKPDLIRKAEPPTKTVEPTMLVIRFPPKTSLPSLAELKARFARFGPIDQSGLRVFWKSSTCRVVFLHKQDAQAALKHALGNSSLFGNVSVRCYLREMGDSAADVSEVAKAKGDDTASESPAVKDLTVLQRQTPVLVQQSLPQPIVQLKSCLKRSSGDESGQVTGNGGSNKGTPRVKFMLGGEESSRGEQLMVGNRNNFTNASFSDGGAPSTTAVGLDFNTKNVQKVISQPPLAPILPLPTQLAKAPEYNLHNSETAPRNTPNFINTTAPATANIDISQQMISLLTRCNDVVSNLTGKLGYVPYHPL